MAGTTGRGQYAAAATPADRGATRERNATRRTGYEKRPMMSPHRSALLASALAIAACAAPPSDAAPGAPSRLGQAIRSLRRSVAGGDRSDAAPVRVVMRVAEDPARATGRGTAAAPPAAAFDSTEWPTTVIPITNE